mmetsp:Transcript_88097/g.197044  ORF Transcript_88097/g.197044 Transcript_88097/m.197044 type:complete len:197 (-) Transcript_88097:15-605(-)
MSLWDCLGNQVCCANRSSPFSSGRGARPKVSARAAVLSTEEARLALQSSAQSSCDPAVPSQDADGSPRRSWGAEEASQDSPKRAAGSQEGSGPELVPHAVLASGEKSASSTESAKTSADAIFSMIDCDNDGVITRAEFNRFQIERQADFTRATAGVVSQSFTCGGSGRGGSYPARDRQDSDPAPVRRLSDFLAGIV